jgi:hypothetical protein
MNLPFSITSVMCTCVIYIYLYTSYFICEYHVRLIIIFINFNSKLKIPIICEVKVVHIQREMIKLFSILFFYRFTHLRTVNG